MGRIPHVIEGGRDSASGVVAGLPMRRQMLCILSFPCMFPTAKLRKGSTRFKPRMLWIDFQTGSLTPPPGGAAPCTLLLARQWVLCIVIAYECMYCLSFWCFRFFSRDRCMVNSTWLESNCWFKMTWEGLHCDLALEQKKSYCLHSSTESQGNRAWGINFILIKQIFVIGGVSQFQFCFLCFFGKVAAKHF